MARRWFIAAALAPAFAAAAPLFDDATSNLGDPQPCADTNEGCYSNYVLMADLTGDEHLDLVFANGGGYYEPGAAAPMAFYVGDGGGGFVEEGGRWFQGFTGRLRQVAAGDIDGDGDLDLLAPDSWASQPDALFVNQGGRFVDEGALRLGTSSRAGATRMGDVDGDLDLDLVISDWGSDPPASPGTARIYLNDGFGFFDEAPGSVPSDTGVVGTGPVDLDLLDADGDLDLDLLLASREGDSLLFFNDGAGRFSFVDNALPPQPGPYAYGPDACDVDGDGDLDLWIDNGSSGLKEQLLINDGRGTYSDQTRRRVSPAANPRADDNEVQCVDANQDGAFDAVITSLSGNERVLLNDGRGHFSEAAGAFPRVDDASLGLDVGDVDGDGRLDAVTAQGERGDFLNRLYLGSVDALIDTRPPRLRASGYRVVGPGVTLLRVAVVDAATTDVGPRLLAAEVRLGGVVIPLRFLGGDLFGARVTGPAGTPATAEVCLTDLRGNRACSGVGIRF